MRVQNQRQQNYWQNPVLRARTHRAQTDGQHRHQKKKSADQAGFNQQPDDQIVGVRRVVGKGVAQRRGKAGKHIIINTGKISEPVAEHWRFQKRQPRNVPHGQAGVIAVIGKRIAAGLRETAKLDQQKGGTYPYSPACKPACCSGRAATQHMQAAQ